MAQGSGGGGGLSNQFMLLDDRNGTISRLYGVDKEGASHPYRTYFIVDPGQVRKIDDENEVDDAECVAEVDMEMVQVVRATGTSDLPIVLSFDEMINQVMLAATVSHCWHCTAGEGRAEGSLVRLLR